MGKPKRNASEKDSNKNLGKKVKYISSYRGVFFTCPQCGSKKRFAMLSEYDGVTYCSELCVLESMKEGD